MIFSVKFTPKNWLRGIGMSFKKKMLKMTPEELQEYLKFKKRGFRVENHKGKGSYKRKSKYGSIV